jgi:hypothetical protein
MSRRTVQIAVIAGFFLLGAVSLARSDAGFLRGLLFVAIGLFLALRFFGKGQESRDGRKGSSAGRATAWTAVRRGLLLLLGQGICIPLFIGFWRSPKAGGLAGLGDSGIFLFFLMTLFLLGFSGFRCALALFQQRRSLWIGVPLVALSAASLVPPLVFTVGMVVLMFDEMFVH